MIGALCPLADWDDCELTKEELGALYQIPDAVAETCVKAIYEKYADDLKRYNATAKLEAEKKELLGDWVDEVDPITKGQITELRAMGVGVKSLSKSADGEGSPKKPAFIKLNLRQAGAFFQFMIEKKGQLEKEFDAKHTPKKSGGGGNRQKFDGEIKITNTEADPDDAGAKFVFKGDEDVVWKKTSSTASSGATQNQKWKAVRSKRYMGGADSKQGDGVCEGAINWDKANGSEAIKATGLSRSQFKQRCGEKTANGFCDKCAKKGQSFFTGTYEMKRGKGVKFNGTTYKDFIAENLEYVPEDEWSPFGK